MSAHVEELRPAVREVMPSVIRDLEALVRIPSVSADPNRREEVERSAEATAALFRAEDFDVASLLVDGGAPAAVARHLGPPGGPTVLLYTHHDVQPEGDLDYWVSDPFDPVVRDGRLHGRGADDDKEGIAAHLAAVRSFKGDLPIGVTVLLEGVDEVRSPSLARFLTAYHEHLAADVSVIADGANWAIGVSGLTTSLRGLGDWQVEVRTLTHAVHSGAWGGVVPDGVTVLTRLLATLHNDQGDVAVTGLKRVHRQGPGYPEEALRTESALAEGVDFIGTGPAIGRLWMKPAIAIVGLDATPVSAASHTLTPSARAKISPRIAPGDSPAFDVAKEALRVAWDGAEPAEMGGGGSIPLVTAFRNFFPNASSLVTGVEDPDTRAHSANEGLHLAEFDRVCLAAALLLINLGPAGVRCAIPSTTFTREMEGPLRTSADIHDVENTVERGFECHPSRIARGNTCHNRGFSPTGTGERQALNRDAPAVEDRHDAKQRCSAGMRGEGCRDRVGLAMAHLNLSVWTPGNKKPLGPMGSEGMRVGYRQPARPSIMVVCSALMCSMLNLEQRPGKLVSRIEISRDLVGLTRKAVLPEGRSRRSVRCAALEDE